MKHRQILEMKIVSKKNNHQKQSWEGVSYVNSSSSDVPALFEKISVAIPSCLWSRMATNVLAKSNTFIEGTVVT